MKLKLLHIIDSLGVGGAEKLLVGTINGVTEDFEQHLIILRDPEIFRKEITCSVQFTNLNCTSFSSLFFKIQKVKSYIKKNKIDIVHSHLYEANLLARLATPRDVKLFNSIHAISSLASYKVNKLSLYLDRLTYKKRHRIISVSKEVEKDFSQYVGIKGPATVLYNYIEEKFFVPHSKENFNLQQLRLVAVGNLRYQKNYPYLVEAFKRLPASVSLDIYGEGAMRKSLQQEIDKHGLKIRLCGTRDDLNKVLPNYDAFVMSSFYEGQPLSLLEAMASGLPVLLSDIPVLREVTGKNAIYFSLSDPDSFKERINEIMLGKYNLGELAAASHSRVNSFAHKHQYIINLKKIYSEL